MNDPNRAPKPSSEYRDNQLVTREQFAFFFQQRVRWAELDPQGIVFNPNYFVYFDTAVGEYMRAIGYGYPAGLSAAGCDMFAVNANATFRGSARYDDDLSIGVRVARIGRTSFSMEIAVYRAQELLVVGTMVYVTASLADKKPVPVPPAFIEAIVAYEHVAPARAHASRPEPAL
jgi:acyl-CoA thioester hydrolase